jgi:hypothetical protein
MKKLIVLMAFVIMESSAFVNADCREWQYYGNTARCVWYDNNTGNGITEFNAGMQQFATSMVNIIQQRRMVKYQAQLQQAQQQETYEQASQVQDARKPICRNGVCY